MHHAAEDRPR